MLTDQDVRQIVDAIMATDQMQWVQSQMQQQGNPAGGEPPQPQEMPPQEMQQQPMEAEPGPMLQGQNDPDQFGGMANPMAMTSQQYGHGKPQMNMAPQPMNQQRYSADEEADTPEENSRSARGPNSIFYLHF